MSPTKCPDCGTVISSKMNDVLLKLVICEPSTLATGCWEWPGAKSDGYGKVKIERKCLRVHRLVYEQFVGPIPADLEIDHLCRNRACANFEHLELVMRKTNILRGVSPCAANAKKTHCPQGHELIGENLRRVSSGQRCCRTCYNAQHRARRARNAAITMS